MLIKLNVIKISSCTKICYLYLLADLVLDDGKIGINNSLPYLLITTGRVNYY